MKDVLTNALNILSALSLMVGCGGTGEANFLPIGIQFRGQLIAPQGLFDGSPSTTYQMGGNIIPGGEDPLITACTTPFGSPPDRSVPPTLYLAETVGYEHPTARQVIMVSPRPYEQIAWDLNQGMPALLPGEFWGVTPIVETVPCSAPLDGVCYYGGRFELPITLEVFPGCPEGVRPPR